MPLQSRPATGGRLPVDQQCPCRSTARTGSSRFQIDGAGMVQRGDVRRQSPLSAMQPDVRGRFHGSFWGILTVIPPWHPAMPTATYPLPGSRSVNFFLGGPLSWPAPKMFWSLGFWSFGFFGLLVFYRSPACTRRFRLLRSSSWMSSAVTGITLTSGVLKSSASQAPS